MVALTSPKVSSIEQWVDLCWGWWWLGLVGLGGSPMFLVTGCWVWIATVLRGEIHEGCFTVRAQPLGVRWRQNLSPQ